MPQLATDSLSIVVRGDFHPVQVVPRWLLDQGLIGEADFETREVKVLDEGTAAEFRVGAFQVDCYRDELEVKTTDETEFERLRDLVSGILRALPGAAVSELGINRGVHFYASDAASWHAIGDSLVNNSIWGDILPLSGMRAVLFEGARADKYAGRVLVQVAPSTHYDNAVYVAYNDHYALTRVHTQPATREELRAVLDSEEPVPLTEKKAVALEVLSGNWNESMRHFIDVLERVAQQGVAAR